MEKMNLYHEFNLEYRSKFNVHVERFNLTILSEFRNYLGDNRSDWDLFTNSLTYVCNTQIHRTTKISPFELVLSRPPPQLVLDINLDVED